MENTYHAGKELHGNMRHMDGRRIESLIDHMQYGHALIAYHKQDGTFRLAKATLLPYKADFRRDYDITRVTSTIAFWDVELQAWKTFQLENFLEWSPIC